MFSSVIKNMMQNNKNHSNQVTEARIRTNLPNDIFIQRRNGLKNKGSSQLRNFGRSITIGGTFGGPGGTWGP